MAESVRTNVDEVQKAMKSFEAIGADELILHPAVADLDEVNKLADAVL